VRRTVGLFFCLVIARPAGADLPRFSASVEVVRLDVSVLKGGRPVKRLRAENFEVWDQGVRQRVELVDEEATAIHAVLALDISESVEGKSLQRLKMAAHAFVDALAPDDALSLLTFAECANLSLVGSRNRGEAHTAIERAVTRHTTGLRDAVAAALTVADPRLGRPLVLVFSDGQDVGSFLDEAAVMKEAADSEAVVHAILPPGSVEAPFLASLADATGGRTARVLHDDHVDRAFLEALDEFRSRYRLRYEPKGVTGDGWHRIKVRLVNTTGGHVRARPGYRARSRSQE
jgi:Ca-activated chloride channel homolog